VPGTFIPDSEVEPTLAVDPRRPRRLVAAWQQDRFVSPGAARSNVTASSRDGGRHWRTKLVPGVSRCTGGDFNRASDPWLSIGREGATYLATLPSAGMGLLAPALLVNRSPDDGRSWSQPVYVDRRDADPVAFNDKEAVTADRFRRGVAYVVWDRNRFLPGVGGTRDLYFARTRDRGRSWSGPRRIYEAALDAPVRVSEVVMTGRRRLVCVFSTIESTFGVMVPGGRVTFWALRSRDGGRSWSAPSRIAEGRQINLADPERATEIRAGPIFSADSAPHGRIYVAWRDARSRRSSRILLSSSRGGRPWSRPRLVSRGAKAAFIPDLAVTRDGTVGVRFYDLRRDRPGDAALTTDSWIRHSHDRGRHWRELRLGRSFDLRAAPILGGVNRALFLGDYQALVALPGGFATVFARARPAARQGPSDIFFTRIKLGR
jgi:hypothetical protein